MHDSAIFLHIAPFPPFSFPVKAILGPWQSLMHNKAYLSFFEEQSKLNTDQMWLDGSSL